MPVSGILVVDKPAGWTSFDVVGFVRGRSREKRVGHAGTLDPMATGVLPVCLGQATRLVEYLVDATKTYLAEVTLGVETNTYDAEGEVIATTDAWHITSKDIESVLTQFRGAFEQRPPAFSAIKRDGVPLYKLARAGESVEVPPRQVTVHRLTVVDYEPPALRIEIECDKGFYVRSLAHDLGVALGTGAMLSGLVRMRVGHFALRNAVDIETLRVEFESGVWQEHLYSPDEILLDWQAAIVGEATERRLRNGLPATFDGSAGASVTKCRAYSTGGDFVGVLRRDAEIWRPEKVFAPA